MIELKDVSVSYHTVLALDTVNLTIQGPTITGILGPNGAGKSTLLKAMLHIIDHQGQTNLDGNDIRKQRNKIAYVEQKAAIDFNFPIKVKECVSLGLYPKIQLFQRLREEDWIKVARALEIVGMAEYADKQISQLSGGQFQRVLIARCLVQEADYIFLDEPFVGIDSVSENIIMTTLRNLKKLGKTILIVHHDLSKVKNYFDQVLLLNREVVAFGETAQTFTKEHLQATYGENLILMEDNKK
ncbi:metal ABC transporter ATP-binding protein [Streptococcus cuniculi]|uniref:Metal ABC transporter ATP-binding protein n=1 Tax=Streptococcus cuniculi TaxID=1432788 RepID=A0A4Y9JDU2_9STRE|nr:metal ABC transporter ATP-binding protein [Streptococcus cuniculi]MBF0777899.1 metal ABC transporter ATP-binding protein [Streptococcus cuniculi]TFU98196.1 metal ABC transporter ATP-binding protein [Streptococcus cuniculi]